MREIKFRGLDINGRWAYGLLSFVDHAYATYIKPKGYYISNSAGSPFAYHVRWETVGEYTGLKDKNGNDIYEGDIIKWLSAPGFDEGCALVMFLNDRGAWYIENDMDNIYDELYNVFDYSEVIGNIHEKKDLING